MKKIYIEPKAKEVKLNFEALLSVTSPIVDETPGIDGLGGTSLESFDEGLAKEDVFGW